MYRGPAQCGSGCRLVRPNRVVVTDTDSNTWGGQSSYVYTLTRRPDGLTDVDEVVVRDARVRAG
jgi:hypothetical protein